MRPVKPGLIAAGVGMAVNVVLAVLKIVTGIVGHSYALIADGIESTADIVSSMVVWTGLKVSALPADEDHPYGHGKAEAIAGMVVALALLAAAVFVAVESIRHILHPSHTPAWFTLLVLAPIIVVKELLYRSVFKIGDELTSSAVKGDAWHHRCDAITSTAAFVGISIALIGGKGYKSADGWAALLASAIIVLNGSRIFLAALGDLMDAALPETIQQEIRALGGSVPGVLRVEKCHARKSGLGLLVEIHVEVDENMTVRRSHELAHAVVDKLKGSPLSIQHVVVHVEPGAPGREPERGP